MWFCESKLLGDFFPWAEFWKGEEMSIPENRHSEILYSFTFIIGKISAQNYKNLTSPERPEFKHLIFSNLGHNITTLTCQIIIFRKKTHLHNLIRTYTFINFWDFSFKTWYWAMWEKILLHCFVKIYSLHVFYFLRNCHLLTPLNGSKRLFGKRWFE